jgi:predicted DCC family thiol-disulfide oxidoreductase YuxK
MGNFAREVFQDGKRPLCQRETQLLKRLDHAGASRFIDISADDFDASALGVTYRR